MNSFHEWLFRKFKKTLSIPLPDTARVAHYAFWASVVMYTDSTFAHYKMTKSTSLNVVIY